MDNFRKEKAKAGRFVADFAKDYRLMLDYVQMGYNPSYNQHYSPKGFLYQYGRIVGQYKLSVGESENYNILYVGREEGIWTIYGENTGEELLSCRLPASIASALYDILEKGRLEEEAKRVAQAQAQPLEETK